MSKDEVSVEHSHGEVFTYPVTMQRLHAQVDVAKDLLDEAAPGIDEMVRRRLAQEMMSAVMPKLDIHRVPTESMDTVRYSARLTVVEDPQDTWVSGRKASTSSATFDGVKEAQRAVEFNCLLKEAIDEVLAEDDTEEEELE